MRHRQIELSDAANNKINASLSILPGVCNVVEPLQLDDAQHINNRTIIDIRLHLCPVLPLVTDFEYIILLFVGPLHSNVLSSTNRNYIGLMYRNARRGGLTCKNDEDRTTDMLRYDTIRYAIFTCNQTAT